ncbi:MAG: histidine kinase, partial [Rhodospirillaceae bacterium]|nr:histidine kinase [Rhodospirillaceae bacterium]
MLALSLAPVAGAATNEAIHLTAETDRMTLSGRMEVLRDGSGALTIDDIVRPEIASGFSPLTGNLSAGFDRAAFWLRFQVNRDAVAVSRW